MPPETQFDRVGTAHKLSFRISQWRIIGWLSRRKKLRRLLALRALPGWFVVIWKALTALSTVESTVRIAKPILQFPNTHPLILFCLGLFYLTLIAVLPETHRQQPLTAELIKPLRVDHVLTQICSLYDYQLGPGQGYKVALVNFLNDPHASQPIELRSVIAKITFYDCNGNAYLTVDQGLWKRGRGPATIAVGRSESLILALIDPAGSPFTIDQTYEGHEFRAFRVGLNPGSNKAIVLVAHSVNGTFETQEFKFSLNLDENLRIEQIKE